MDHHHSTRSRRRRRRHHVGTSATKPTTSRFPDRRLVASPHDDHEHDDHDVVLLRDSVVALRRPDPRTVVTRFDHDDSDDDDSDDDFDRCYLSVALDDEHRRAAAGAVSLGRIPDVDAYVTSHRFQPFWSRPFASSSSDDEGLASVPSETQCLLVRSRRRGPRRYALFVPLFEPDGPVRASLRGRGDPAYDPVHLYEPCFGRDDDDQCGRERRPGEVPLHLVLETGDPYTPLWTGAADGRKTTAPLLLVSTCTSDDPYELCRRTAEALRRDNVIPGCRLRREKPPPTVLTDKLGWCTWNAYKRHYDERKVLEGLETLGQKCSLNHGDVKDDVTKKDERSDDDDGDDDDDWVLLEDDEDDAAHRAPSGTTVPSFRPRWMILDDGWQHVSPPRDPTGELRLASLGADPVKFTNGALKTLVDAAKTRHGVEKLLVWHAITGYWGGVEDAVVAPTTKVEDAVRFYGADVLSHDPSADHFGQGGVVGVIQGDPSSFFRDYHERLASWGVDGVKIDAQATLEGLGVRRGGRVRMNKLYREAMEKSTTKYFAGRVGQEDEPKTMSTQTGRKDRRRQKLRSREQSDNTSNNNNNNNNDTPLLINCMSHANETYLQCTRSTLMRTSTDYYPLTPSLDGLHLWSNAVNGGYWFGQFVAPDHDVFTTDSEYHAAARAISGAPVYFSDAPEDVDPRVLRKLASTTTAEVFRCDGGPARCAPDCLFEDPTRATSRAALRIFNTTSSDDGARPPAVVVGAWDARHDGGGGKALSCAVDPWRDLPRGAVREDVVYAAYAVRRREVRRSSSKSASSWTIDLSSPNASWELVHYVPFVDGLAVVGLVDAYNCPATVDRVVDDGDFLTLEVKDAGELLVVVDDDGTRADRHDDLRATVNGRPVEARRVGNRLSVRVARPGRNRVSIAR